MQVASLAYFTFDFGVNPIGASAQVAPVVEVEPVYEPSVLIVTNAELRASFGFVQSEKGQQEESGERRSAVSVFTLFKYFSGTGTQICASPYRRVF
ncbi:hypothetical protein LSG31_01655 [Fodinisporobacter ferrooxydans]|uniref:Uncharacterized protein n=1 Tax=Fodinisporobacter ferrooxydans TaxID=2901836 RepID=A0ABY4CKS5_9BACL|nr:hypothetical protein LSG31_01655 [Alicyclobacillaceae bacterium MYW30-H2]